MNEFSEGDLIEATKGEQVIRARAKGNGGEPALSVAGGFYWLSSLRRDGYTLTVIEKAAPALPTEPGVYIGSRMPSLPMWLDDNGVWRTVRTRVMDPRRHAPFTRLEPVADTAKKVLDRFSEVHGASFITLTETIMQVREEFGVTS